MEFMSTFPEDAEESYAFSTFCPVEIFKRPDGKRLCREQLHGRSTALGCGIVGAGPARKIVGLDWLGRQNLP